MNKSIIKVGKATLVLSVTLIISCQSNEVANDPVVSEIEQVEVEQEMIDDIDLSVTYQVPTPNELFTLFNQVDVNFDATLLNPTSNADKYSANKNKSLAFGVYSADLAFAANFGEATESLSYFSAIKNIGDELNVNNAFDQLVFDRIEQNIQENNSDSLFNLSNETYYNAYSYLKDNDRGATLSLIVVGGWVESLYILTHLLDPNDGSELLSRIADQRLTLENLYGFMAEFQSDSDVAEVIEALEPVDQILMSLEPQESAVTTEVGDDGTYSLGGGADYVLSQEEFSSLKEAVGSLRNAIIESEI